MPYKDPEKARAYERERHRKRTADRLGRGLCPRCGKIPPAPGRSLCEPCGERDRETRRARYAEARAGGAPYGGRDPESRRRMARERARKRRRERVEAGLCPRCGREPVEAGAVCETCRETRRAEERKLYAARRAKGLCGRCGAEVVDEGFDVRFVRRKRRKTPAAQERREQETLSRQAGTVALCRLRRPCGRRGEMYSLRAPIVSLLGRAQGNARLSAALHRGRTSHRHRARTPRLLGGGGDVSCLRQALSGSGRGRGG